MLFKITMHSDLYFKITKSLLICVSLRVTALVLQDKKLLILILSEIQLLNIYFK